ncbi:uncharacterized protein J3R85_006894 [Psidium guajava]|nr:uncharacterized protein J3R85_006894 [Psidium guajava]
MTSKLLPIPLADSLDPHTSSLNSTCSLAPFTFTFLLSPWRISATTRLAMSLAAVSTGRRADLALELDDILAGEREEWK